MAVPGTRFVLKRLNWRDYGDHLIRQPGAVAVASFATFEEADLERATRENARRKTVNPFTSGFGVHSWTHLDEPRLRDWLMDRGIDPPDAPKEGRTDWAAWWQKNHKKLTPEKRAAVWEALDKVRFFAVAEEPVRPVGYAIVEVNWNYNDEYYDADPEGSRLVVVYRTRERAKAECARHNEAATQDQWAHVAGDGSEGEFDPDHDLPAFDMQDRLVHRRGLKGREQLKPGEGLYASSTGVPFYEVIEIPLEESA